MINKVVLLFIFISLSLYSKDLKDNLTVNSGYGFSYTPLDFWKRKNNNLYYSMDGSSLSIQFENSYLDLRLYADLLMRRLKDKYLDFVIDKIFEETKNAKRLIFTNGRFKVLFKNRKISLKFYSIIFSNYQKKIVLFVSYPEDIDKNKEQFLLNFKNTLKFNNKNTNKKYTENFKEYKNERFDYKLLLPESYKEVKEGIWITENGSVITVNLYETELPLKEFGNLYIERLRKKYKKAVVLSTVSERINGFEVFEIKIKNFNLELNNVFYKKGDRIYVLSIYGKNYFEKIKKSFQNLKKY